MQDLHLVGYTTDRRHLIFSARKGSKSGGFVVPVDDELRAAVRDLSGDHADTVADDGGAGAGPADEPVTAPPPPRVEARLSVREVQARLRAGEDVAQVAADAGVDPDWVERFAPPVRAEQRQMVERALRMRMQRPRGAASTVPLRRAAAAAMAERGVPFTAESFDAAWTARLVGADRWVVELHYHHRGRMRSASWTVDSDAGVLTAADRTASQIGFVPEGQAVPPESQTIRSALTITTGAPADAPGPDPTAAPTGASSKPVRKKKATARRKAPAKKAAPKKAGRKKAAARQAAPGKAGRKKAAPKKQGVAKRTAKKKAVAKKTAAKKAVAKKTAKKKAAPKKAVAKKAGRKKAASKQAAPPPPPPPPPPTPTPTPTPTPEPAPAPPDARPVVRLRSPEPPAAPAEPVAAEPTPDRSVDDRRARTAERTSPTVQFRGAAVPVRDSGANGAADPRQVRISSDPTRSTAVAPSTNGRDAAPRRRRQLRAR